MGNIRQDTLEDIWNNETMKEYRRQSLNGTLPCLRGCLLLGDGLDASIRKISMRLTVGYAQLKYLIVLYGRGCNLRCLMCEQDHSSKVSLDLGTLKKNIKFDHIRGVEIFGGEPLALKGARDFFDFLISKGIKVGLITNGMILDDGLAQKVALNCSQITFSVNAATKETHEKINRGSRWETVLDHINKIKSYRDKYKTDVILHGHMTIVVPNIREIPGFIKNYKRFGFDRIDFGFDRKTVPPFLDKYPQIKTRLRSVIKKTLRTKKPSQVWGHTLKSLGLAAVILAFILSLPVYAAPVIDHASSRGAYLVKTKTGMFLTAEVNIADDQNIVQRSDYRVEMIMPNGKKVKLRPMERIEAMLTMGTPALISVDDAYQSGGSTGDYVFILSDDQGKVLDTYSDFLVPFRDYTGEGIGDFDEAYMSPQNGAFIKMDPQKDPHLTFKWNKVRGAARYRLKVYKRDVTRWPRMVFRQMTDKTEIDVPIKEFTKDKYYWSVEAIHEDGNNWNNTARYTLDGTKRPFFYIK